MYRMFHSTHKSAITANSSQMKTKNICCIFHSARKNCKLMKNANIHRTKWEMPKYILNFLLKTINSSYR